MSIELESQATEYQQLLKELKPKVLCSQMKAALAVNSELIALHEPIPLKQLYRDRFILGNYKVN